MKGGWGILVLLALLALAHGTGAEEGVCSREKAQRIVSATFTSVLKRDVDPGALEVHLLAKKEDVGCTGSPQS